MELSYAVQPSPDGLAQAFIIGADFIGNDSIAMVLGDNIFAGHGLKKRLKNRNKCSEFFRESFAILELFRDGF